MTSEHGAGRVLLSQVSGELFSIFMQSNQEYHNKDVTLFSLRSNQSIIVVKRLVFILFINLNSAHSAGKVGPGIPTLSPVLKRDVLSEESRCLQRVPFSFVP